MSSGSGGRRESSGRNRTKDPCLGKVALGRSHVDHDDHSDHDDHADHHDHADHDHDFREKCTWGKRARALSERYGYAKVIVTIAIIVVIRIIIITWPNLP